MRTGPGLPERAISNALRIVGYSSSGFSTRNECLVKGSVMPITFVSWKESLPSAGRPTCPVMATSGTESIWAVASPVTRFVAPGPLVATTTPTRFVALA